MSAQTAALDALIRAHCRELKLPTIARRYQQLAGEAIRSQQTQTAYLAALRVEAHFAGVCCVIAADAIHAAHREQGLRIGHWQADRSRWRENK